MRAFLLISLLMATANGSEPAPWPESLQVEAEFTVTNPGSLPRGLDFDQITVEGHDPHDIGICWLDLNGDGNRELIIDSHEGGTGGSYKMIFEKTPSGFRQIATWMGSISFVTAANGYYQIESWSSGGGGVFSRALFCYEKGRYSMVRLEDWRGFGDEEGWQFIRSRDPKEHDHN